MNLFLLVILPLVRPILRLTSLHNLVRKLVKKTDNSFDDKCAEIFIEICKTI